MPEFWGAISKLEAHYGKLKMPAARTPFELILYENIAYLVSEDQREQAFRELKKHVGTRPADLLTAKLEELAEIAAIGGIFPDLRARRLQESARLMRDEFGGDLKRVLTGELVEARRALEKFPAIGEPGAEKILLFTGTHAALAPESNGLRVLVRLGLAKEHKNYSTMYRQARKQLREVVGDQCGPLIEAHLLLKRHGQELCRRTAPRCEACPLQRECPSVKTRHRQ
jgi:endonuclease-3